MRKLFTNLTFWVLLAITAGILIGHYAPDIALYPVMKNPWKAKFMGQDLSVGATVSEFLSGGFISIVKLFINPIIFLTIITGIVNMGNLKKAGRVGIKALLYFEVVTTFALVTGIAVALLIQPGRGVDTSKLKAGDISNYTKPGAFSWIHFFETNITLQVLIVALLLGIFLNYYKHRQRIVDFLLIISKYVFKGLHAVMLLAPIGAFGGMAFTISKYGINTLLPLAKLMGTVYITMAVFVLLVLWLILKHFRVSIFKYLRYVREEL
ncbi:MAG TPA: cation:dicarboxylase symporter family transporter, partial [Chitinophagaceae bacterium]